MNVFTRPTAAALLVLFSTFLTATTAAQQKRQTPAKTPPKAAVAPTPAPTFDTLIPADSYIIYGEVRSVGQLIQSSAINELLEPILKLAGPSKEFKTLVKWLNAHADEVMTSRLLVAAWPRAKDVPDGIVAIEFASPEEAAKFAKPLNEVLPTILPPLPASSPDQPDKAVTPDKSKVTTAAERPRYYFQQAGSLILLTPRPLTLKQLKRAGSKPLAEDQNFRAARNRFHSEPLFVFIDFKAIQKEEEERQKRFEAMRKEEEERVKAAQTESKQAEEVPESELTDEEKAALAAEEMAKLQAASTPEAMKEAPPPDPISTALSTIGRSFFSGMTEWPDGLGLALSFENDSFDLRALLVNPPGEKSGAIPLVPMLIPGPPLVPESPNILPADTELLATMSLDLPQIYEAMTRPHPRVEFVNTPRRPINMSEAEFESPFAAIEKQLKINIKDDLLPLLGSEIALRLPLTNFGLFGLPIPAVTNSESKDSAANQQPSSTAGPVVGISGNSAAAPVVAISVKDRDAMRTLMPKLIDSLGFKGASAFAQTERREDTEIVSYINLFSYAFVGNFLVLSPDPASVRHVVNSYLKHNTLASETQFRSYTRWLPRPLQGQLYISPSLMESYKGLADSTLLSDHTRAHFARLTAMAQPITYSLSNEGFGPLHELHLPKNLVMMAVVGISGEANPPPKIRNERMALGLMYSIAHGQEQYKTTKGNGSYGTLEQLIAADLVPKAMVESSGYRIELTVSGDKFEVSAVPLEYGKTGTMSYFIDDTLVLRGGDRNGASATSSDPPIH